MMTFYCAEVVKGKIVGVRRFGTVQDTDGLKLPLTLTEYMLLRCQSKIEIEALSLIMDTKKIAARIQDKLDRYNNEQS